MPLLPRGFAITRLRHARRAADRLALLDVRQILGTQTRRAGREWDGDGRPVRRYATVAAIVGLVLLAVWARDDAKLRIVVEGGRVQMEPAWIRLRIRVEPDALNRALTVALIGDGFETSSLEQLEGDRARITRWIEYKDVPAGVYAVVAEVYRPPEQAWHAEAEVTVISR